MRLARLSRGALVAALLGTGPLCADVWDDATEPDNGNTTDNVPVHGMDQLHDLAGIIGSVIDADWFRLCLADFHSYQAVVDGLTGDLSEGGSLNLDLVDAAGNVLLAADQNGVGDQNLTLSLQSQPSGCGSRWLRVSGPDCGTVCDGSDRYRIRFYDTTIAVPRYNNANGQVTVLIVQNTLDYPVGVNARLWNASGTFVAVVSRVLNPFEAMVSNLATEQGGIANGTSGTITIDSNAGYGALAAKAVALEPSSGYSFDSPGLYRPH